MDTLPPHAFEGNPPFVTIPLTQGKFAIVDPEDADLGAYKWHINSRYAARVVQGQLHSMHRVILERKLGRSIQKHHVDHINGDPLDNRRENLREATLSQNYANSKKTSSRTSSSYKGVSRTGDGKWAAYIGHRGQIIYLGRFETEAQAANAYDKAAIELFGEYARTNGVITQTSVESAIRPSHSRVKNTSGYRGVSSKGKKWSAQLSFNHKSIYLGLFADPVEAAKAYDKAAIEMCGDKALTNFPLENYGLVSLPKQKPTRSKYQRKTISHSETSFMQDGDQIFVAISTSQQKTLLVDVEDSDLAQVRWTVSSLNYATSSRSGNDFRSRERIHRIILQRKLGRPIADGMSADHINGDRLDNRRKNLREVTHQQNMFNRVKRIDNPSGHKGVVKRGKKWQAGITKDQAFFYLGMFATPDEAVEAYNKAAIELFGDYAKLEQGRNQ